MGWVVSDERLSSISVFSWVLAGFPFFPIASVYLTPCFPGLSSGETTTNLEGSTFARSRILFHSLDDQTIGVFLSCKHAMMLFSFGLVVSSDFRSNIAHLSNHTYEKHDQISVNSLYVVFYPGPLSILYLINCQMIFYPLSLLCISSESWHAHFAEVFGHQLMLEPNIHCHTTLHYECSYCKLCLYFSRGLPDLLTKEVAQNFPQAEQILAI